MAGQEVRVGGFEQRVYGLLLASLSQSLVILERALSGVEGWKVFDC
jgi:hypothetical protein